MLAICGMHGAYCYIYNLANINGINHRHSADVYIHAYNNKDSYNYTDLHSLANLYTDSGTMRSHELYRRDAI